MKFGLIKFCIPLDFEVLSSTTNSGVDDRYGFFREVVNRGHELTIFTPLVKGSKNNPKEERWITSHRTEIPNDLSFIKKFGYTPASLPVDDLKVDVLICEAGVGNMQFPNFYHEDPQSPEGSLIRRFAHVINAHKGLVIYMHNDPSLPFYFRQMAGRKYQWGHKNNGYTNPIEKNRQSKWVRDSGWATYDEMFSDKKSVLLTRCLPEKFDFMMDNFDVDRAGYNEFKDKLNIEYMPPAYAYDLANNFNYNMDVKYPLFYSGGDRRRRIAFRRFYEEMDVPTYVSGKWKEEAMETFDGINFLGWSETRRDLLELINKSGCVTQIQPKDASKMGWWTARTMEVPACRAMCFIDGSINRAEDFVFDNWFVLKNKEDAIYKIKSFLSMSYTYRIKIIETQLRYCMTNFTWKKFTDNFISICYKYLNNESINNRFKHKKYDDYISIWSENINIPKELISDKNVLDNFIIEENNVEESEKNIEENNDIIIDNSILPFKDIPLLI